MLHEVSIAARHAEIGRIYARYELESDEFLTREQKAERILNETTA